MRLRTARKIVKAVGTSREPSYSNAQIGKAQDRIDRTRSAKELNAWWCDLMDRLGPEGRAGLVQRLKPLDTSSARSIEPTDRAGIPRDREQIISDNFNELLDTLFNVPFLFWVCPKGCRDRVCWHPAENGGQRAECLRCGQWSDCYPPKAI